MKLRSYWKNYWKAIGELLEQMKLSYVLDMTGYMRIRYGIEELLLALYKI